MEEDIKKLKAVLRSLVVSSPTQVDLRSLLRDYRSMMGEYLPVGKYGYRDPMTFLKERCNDCFIFSGPFSNPVLTLIVPDSLKHIDKFVRKQKTSTMAKVKGKRQSIPQDNLIVNTFKSKQNTVRKPEPLMSLNIVSPFTKEPPQTTTQQAALSNKIEEQLEKLKLTEKVDNNNVSEKPASNDPKYCDKNYNYNSKENNFSSKEDNHSLKDKSYGTGDKNYSSRENNSSSKEDNYGSKDKSYSSRHNNYSSRENNSSSKEDSYSSKDKSYSSRYNNYRSRENNSSSKEDNYSSKDKSYSSRDNNYSSRENNSSSKGDYNSKEISCGSKGKDYGSKENNSSSKDALISFMRKRIPVYDDETTWGTDLNSSQDNDSEKQTSSSSSSSKLAKLDILKSEIIELIAEHTEGIWCTDLIGLYRDRYKKELNFTRYGYTSVISLIYALDTVHATRPRDTGDWLLAVTSSSLPSVPSAPPAPPQHRHARQRQAQVDPDDALPGIEFDPDVFPSDCLHYMESIPPPREDAEPGSLLEVVVGEVYSPSHFWIIRLGDQHNIAMENIMDDMNEYYGSGEGATRQLASGALRVGHYCAALYDQHWHRAIIVQILHADTVKVRHVDYGTVTRCSASSLRPLRREWGALEAQGVRARLAGVRPAARGRRWTRPAAAAFLHRVRDTPLVAHVAAADHQENILEVFLIDTSGEDDVCIGSTLVRSGHADARPDSALTVSPPPARPAPPDLRSLLGTLSSCRPARITAEEEGEEAEEASEVSCSASQVAGRAPRRLPQWEAPSDSEDALSVLSSLSSSRLARIVALRSRVKLPAEPEPGPDVTLTSQLLRHRLALYERMKS